MSLHSLLTWFEVSRDEALHKHSMSCCLVFDIEASAALVSLDLTIKL